jgi:hypothetical protein
MFTRKNGCHPSRVLRRNSQRTSKPRSARTSTVQARETARGPRRTIRNDSRRQACLKGAFDLRKFQRDQRERFVTSVLRGKNQMPPWGDILKPEEVEALWDYVVTGVK